LSVACISLHLRQFQGMSWVIASSGMSSKKMKMPMISARTAGSSWAGATEKPQLPLIVVVAP
jgi:hypothetical protein